MYLDLQLINTEQWANVKTVVGSDNIFIMLQQGWRALGGTILLVPGAVNPMPNQAPPPGSTEFTAQPVMFMGLPLSALNHFTPPPVVASTAAATSFTVQRDANGQATVVPVTVVTPPVVPAAPAQLISTTVTKEQLDEAVRSALAVQMAAFQAQQASTLTPPAIAPDDMTGRGPKRHDVTSQADALKSPRSGRM